MRVITERELALDHFFKNVWCEQSVLLLSDLKWSKSKKNSLHVYKKVITTWGI